MSKKVLVPLAHGFEELEAVTVIDIMRRAEIDVTVASLTGEREVTASRGCVMLADTSLDEVSQNEFDMLVLPGGMPGTTTLRDDPRIITLVQKRWANNQFIAAICAAPMVLLKAGILDGKCISCFPGSVAQDAAPLLRVSSALVEVDLPLITAKGPGAAMDFALTLVGILQGDGVREAVAQALQRN